MEAFVSHYILSEARSRGFTGAKFGINRVQNSQQNATADDNSTGIDENDTLPDAADENSTNATARQLFR